MKQQHDQSRADTYQIVTDKIVAQLEQGTRPWVMPFTSGPIHKPLRHNAVPYRGINVLILWMAAQEKGYNTPIWMTFNQAREVGGFVKKGERGTGIVYYGQGTKEEERDDGTTEDRVISFLKSYAVFNVQQIDGLPEIYYSTLSPKYSNAGQRNAAADTFLSNLGANFRHGGSRAYYSLDIDQIWVPKFDDFRTAEDYYSVAAHEHTHWTRHPTRLDRDFGRKRWGDAGYAMEELVAELGAAFLMADLEIENQPREDHASYIESWIQVLKKDKRSIFTAAQHAQKALDFMHNLQTKPEPKPEPTI